MFKYIKALKDSVYLTYIGLFGGEVIGKELYLLWAIHLRTKKPALIKSCNITKITSGDVLFVCHDRGPTTITMCSLNSRQAFFDAGKVRIK